MRPGVYIKTYGCQMNEYDSEKMLAGLVKTHRRVSTMEEAEVILVNTCSVREKAAHKLYSLLGRIQELKSERPDVVVGVGGCLAQQDGQTIIKRSKAVDFVVGTHNLSLVPSLVTRAKISPSKEVAIDYREDWEELPDDFQEIPSVEEAKHFRTAYNNPVRALVAIQRGCSKMCSFCVVPNTRGPEVSRDINEIIREVKLKVRLGAKEVMLLGQTVNSYGKDLSPRVKFETLIEKLANITGLERIRFTSPHPAEVKKEFVELYGSVPELCPHIHLPLQSGNDRILKLMNRNYRVKRYLEIVDLLRERVPGIAITSDIIVGFPTETDEEFEDTLEIMRKVRYNSSYSFKYSCRPNTVAKSSYGKYDEISPNLAQSRLSKLQKLQDEHSLEHNENLIGSKCKVLLECINKDDGSAKGRSPENILVEVANVGNSKIGSEVEVIIKDASPRCLKAVGIEGMMLNNG